jgi:hypothetical protein
VTDTSGYILKIATNQWVTQVFSLAMYYTALRRKWRPDQTVLFVHKTSFGDAMVGYGVVGDVREKGDLSDPEKNMCNRNGWKRVIEFKYVVQFEHPLSIRDTFLSSLKLRGKFLHGLPLKENQVESLVEQGEKPV